MATPSQRTALAAVRPDLDVNALTDKQVNLAIFDNRAAVREYQNRSPAQVAQERAEMNFQEALNIIGANRDMFAGLGQPGDPATQALINQEMEYGAAAANRAQNVARDQAAASGLGGGGNLDIRERMIQEDLNRRNIAAMRNIRSGQLAEGRAGVSRANELASQAFFQQGFELPESGQGQAFQSRFPTYNFALPGTTAQRSTAAPIGTRAAKRPLTTLPTQPSSITVRR